MKPPAYEWAAWAYRAAMAVISTYAMVMLAWMTWRFMHAEDWPAAVLPELLKMLGWTVLGLLGLLIIQQLGLVARNLVRNLKINAPGGVSVDVTGHDTAKGDGQ